jgi:uncharacterized protein (TIGR02246 family)
METKVPVRRRRACPKALAAGLALLSIAVAASSPAAGLAPLPATPTGTTGGCGGEAKTGCGGDSTSTNAPAAASKSGSSASRGTAAGGGAAAEIASFNQRFALAGLHMDNTAIMALYADDGVHLLPGMAPLVGKPSIAKWLDGVVSQMPGYHVTLNEMEFHDIRITGDWASEWGTTHQVVQPPDGKPPIDNRGKILLVLRRDKSAGWRIVEEMWNSAPAATP